jgi:hypothetical protein
LVTLAYSSEENASVKRADKEVNRHLRAYAFDRATIDDWQMLVPIAHGGIHDSLNERNKHLPIVYSGSMKDVGSEITIYLCIGTLHSRVLFRARR